MGWFDWLDSDVAKHAKQEHAATQALKEIDEHLDLLKGNYSDVADEHRTALNARKDTLTDHLEAHKEARGSGKGVDIAHTNLKDSTANAKTSIGNSAKFIEKNAEFDKIAKTGKYTNPTVKFFKTGVKGALGLGVGLTALAAGAIYVGSKRDEAARDSRQSLRDQEMAALNAQLQAQTLAQPAPQMVMMDERDLGKPIPQLGDDTLMGLQKREGAKVAALGRGKQNMLEFSQPTPDIGQSALPA